MSFGRFMNLVNQVVEEARSGALLTEELYQSVLELAPASWCQSQPKTVAVAIRELGRLCNWWEFVWANKSLYDGASLDELQQRINRFHDEEEIRARPKMPSNAVQNDCWSENGPMPITAKNPLAPFAAQRLGASSLILGDADDGLTGTNKGYSLGRLRQFF
jgi:hypothetical protein